MKIERAWIFAACLGVVAAHFIGCSDDSTATTSSSSSSSGNAGAGGEGGSGGSGGGSSSSSSGMPPECMTAADCPNNGPANFCGEPECANGKCGRKGLQPPGTPLPSQLYGDCVERQCDATFNITDVPADLDIYDDAKECTTDVCNAGVAAHDPVAQGTLCTQPNGAQGVCDGAGACLTCIDGVQSCTGAFVCQMNSCVNMKCTNTVQDPGESDVDCGAVGCLPCDDGKLCANFTNCKSSVCVAGMCAAPTCTDMIKNGNETGFDCGGADCNKCPDNEACAVGNDCQSGVCKGGVCFAPECTDAIQNGDETGVDCGGACPTPCP